MIPLPAFYAVLLAAPVLFGLGCLTGAYIYHCARTGRSPLPAVPSVESIKKAFGRGEKEPEEPGRPTAPRLTC